MSNPIKRRGCVLLGRIWLGCRLGIKRSTPQNQLAVYLDILLTAAGKQIENVLNLQYAQYAT